jgi:hypothetical protein
MWNYNCLSHTEKYMLDCLVIFHFLKNIL